MIYFNTGKFKGSIWLSKYTESSIVNITKPEITFKINRCYIPIIIDTLTKLK